MAEKHEQAESDYMAGMKYKDIAEKYSVTLSTVKSWKQRYEWFRVKEKVTRGKVYKSIPTKETLHQTKEEWKEIEGYDGKYVISNTGKVKRRNKRGSYVEVRTSRSDKGYWYFKLISKNEKKTVSLHRLVAKYFVENPMNLTEVNHKNENKDDNNAGNLEWCTRRYNNCYGTRIERQVKTRMAVKRHG